MKKFLYLASICLAMLFTSCEDFLTVESPDELTSDNFWRDKNDAEAGLSAAYSQLYHGDAYATSEVRWPVEEYRSDICMLGTDAGNYDQWVGLYNFTYTNGNTQFSYYYQDLYRGINFTNQVLAKVPEIPAEKLDETSRSQILNEAHFLRGYYHLMALLNWEKIIIRDEYITENNQLNKGLSERADAWKFVIDELAYGRNLPDVRDNTETGRATSGAANAYLGFAFLTRAYEETAQKDAHLTAALTALKAVQSSTAGYTLVSGDKFIDMFNGTNKNCKESIFEVQFTKNEANGSSHISWMHNWIASSELGGWDEILPNDFLMEEYKREGVKADGLYDNRLYATIYFQCPYFNDGTGKVMGKDYNYFFSKHDKDDNIISGTEYDKPSFRKFTPRTLDEMGESCAFNIPLMRYANVLLMIAEVLNEQGHPDQAVPYINEVRREHGGMPGIDANSDYNAVKKQIEHERIIEFPLESYRWYDMRRWGVTAERLQAIGRTGYDEAKAFYPIPKWELDANPLVSE